MSNKSNNVDPIVAMSNTMLYLQRRLEETEQKLAFREKDLALAEKHIAETEQRYSTEYTLDYEWMDYDPKNTYCYSGVKGMLPIVLGQYEVNIDRKSDIVVCLGNVFERESRIHKYVRQLEITHHIDNAYKIESGEIEGWVLKKVCLIHLDKHLQYKNE